MKNAFGRFSSKMEKEYVALRQSLIDAKIDSREAARGLLQNIRKRALVLGGVVLVTGALTVLVLPDTKAWVMLIGGVCVLWLVGTTLKGYRMIGRYIREEFSDEG